MLAGATTTALTGILGHDQVVRSMPNTPARLGKGMTVWYATPETTETQRAQAAALLGALGTQLEVDDEKMVAMATAVSGTGPTYVFLVMEALIDAAVHLGFPRHIAHDLVIETLEGSTLFAKQSGMHPAELRNMVTSPGGTSAAALHELESGRLRTVLSEAVWAAYRRTVELGDQLEASVGPADHRRTPIRGSMTAVPLHIDHGGPRLMPTAADDTVCRALDRGDRRGRRAARVPAPPARPRRSPTRPRPAGARQLFTLSLRGGYPNQLTASEKPISDPQWSPDGRRLAFVRDDEIWVIEADGSRSRSASSPSPVAAASRAGRPTATAWHSCRAVAAGRRSGSSMPRCRAAAGRPTTRSRRARRP